MFRTNDYGDARYGYVKKNFYQTIIIVPIIHVFLIWLVYLSLGTKSMIYFISVLIYILAFLIFAFYSLFKQLKRQNRTITEIAFNNDDIKIGTDYLLWYDGLEFRLKKSEIQFKKRKFENYGKNTIKEGLQFNIDGKEFYLVKEYFDDYDEIVKLLN